MERLRRKKVNILGVSIDSTSTAQVLRYVRGRLYEFSKKTAPFKKFYIVTPNPEHVMRALTDDVFAKILNSADISIPDGIGLVAAHKFLQLPKTENLIIKPVLYFAQGLGVGFSILFDRQWLTSELKPIRGRELFLDLIQLANKKGWRVFLVGDRLKSAQKAKQELIKNYKTAKLFASNGPNLDDDGNPLTLEDEEVEEEVANTINKIAPHILFIGFGAPRQEKWVYRWLPKLNIGGAMVVGGTFDYISGKKKYPPEWIADAGLEWIWRLILGDQKTKRVLSASLKFPLKIFWEKLKN